MKSQSSKTVIPLEPIQGFLDGLRPTPIQTVWEWSDANRVLGSGAAAEPGPYRTARFPFLFKIYEDLSPMSAVQKVVVMKAAQLGFTEATINTIGCYMDIAACPIIYVTATNDMAENVSKERLDVMIENCEPLRAKVPKKGGKEGGNTNLYKTFPGGSITLTGSNSASALRSRPARVLVLDEVDSYASDLQGEGSPVVLAERRTATFGDRRKVVMFSTPKLEETSIIKKEFELTEQQKYNVPCPHCGTMQELIWEQMRWEQGKPNTAQYQCIHCEELIEERHKPRMLAAGSWVATKPENFRATVRGYHINALYSPYGQYSWSDAVDLYEKGLTNATDMKGFVNTVLGFPYQEESDAPDWERLYERRSVYQMGTVNRDVGLITAGADVQGDRIEVEVVGWCKRKISYSIEYLIIHGNTTQPQVWAELAKIVQREYVRDDGKQMRINRMFIDAGYNTQHVYDFCLAHGMMIAMPIKGQEHLGTIVSTPNEIIHHTQTGKRMNGLRLWPVGVNVVKSELYNWLRLSNTGDEVPDGYCFFPQYDEKYFRGITAEALQYKDIRGYDRPMWVKKYPRNEPLDCRVYARAAAYSLGMERFSDDYWEQLLSYASEPQYQPAPNEGNRKPSSFWRR